MRANEIIYDVEKLKKIQSWKMGWVLPSGEILPCRLYDHVDAFIKKHGVDDHIDEINMDYDREVESLDSISDMCADEGAGYHIYELAVDEEKQTRNARIISYAYSLGWGRICITKCDNLLEIDGFVQDEERLVRIGKDLSEMFDMNFRFNIQKVKKKR